MKHESALFTLAAIAIASAMSTGCSSPPPPPPTVNEILASEIVVLNLSSSAKSQADVKGAGRFMEVVNPLSVVALPGGGKRAQVRLRNTTQEQYAVRYSFIWFDADGMEIVRRPPRTPAIDPLSTLSLTDVYIEPNGSRAEIEMRLLPASEATDDGLYSFDEAAEQLVQKFEADAQFDKAYQAVAAKLGADRKPVIVVRALENNVVGERLASKLDSLAKDFRKEVRKAGKVDLKEDESTQLLVDRIRFSADGGLESGELLNALKTHVSPDFVLTGELVSDSIDAYRLDLKLIDLSGASGRGGTIAWEDKAKIRKAQ